MTKQLLTVICVLSGFASVLSAQINTGAIRIRPVPNPVFAGRYMLIYDIDRSKLGAFETTAQLFLRTRQFPTGAMITTVGLPPQNRTDTIPVNFAGQPQSVDLQLFFATWNKRDESNWFQVTYSPVSSVDAAITDAVQPIFLAESTVEISIQKYQDSEVAVKMVNSLGQIMLEKIERREAGWHKIFLDASGLPSGVYPVSVLWEGQKLCRMVHIVR